MGLRRRYYTQPPYIDETRWERITLDDALWSNHVSRSQPEDLPAKEVRVRPGPLRVRVSTQFSHVEQRPVQQIVEVADDRVRGQNRKRSEVRTVYAPTEVQDDRCDAYASARFAPEREYVLQYEYFGYARCRLLCLERSLSGPLTAAEPRPCESQ